MGLFLWLVGDWKRPSQQGWALGVVGKVLVVGVLDGLSGWFAQKPQLLREQFDITRSELLKLNDRKKSYQLLGALNHEWMGTVEL